jgi:WD40 repeat protein/transcriptional regulator with XRE-family HTH domain
MVTTNQPPVFDSFSTFGDLLKYLRRRERLTQLELSIAVGYSEAQVSRLEKNLRPPDLTAVKALFLPALHLEREPELASRLLELAQSARQEDAPAPGIAPYKGLLFFDEGDADLFFGREALIAALVAHVNALTGRRSSRLLALVGASGSGKSSLLRAGLAVALKQKGWQTHVFTPTAQPLLTLDSQRARADANGHAPAARRVWLVDQFEEVFTLCRDDAARAAFVDRLLGLANESGGGTVVIALRADFYAHCAQYPLLRQAVAAEQVYIGQMSTEELRRAIEEPARHGGWAIEPALVDILLRDIGAGGALDQEPGALPLLSHALLATWERRRGRTFTLEGYRASGGVRGAIAETAESVFADELDAQQQALAHAIFLRLTELGEGTEDTRRRATLTELVPQAQAAAQVRAVLNTLADARLVSLGENSAEVAHEALIREWGRLREWLAEDRENLRLHRHLTEAAHEWEMLGRDSGALYRGARLAQALEWASGASGLNEHERAFLDASQQWAEREAAEREAQHRRELDAAQVLAREQSVAAKRLRRRAYFLGTAFVLAIILAGLALYFGEQAQASARTALSREIAANAIANLDVDPERSLLLAREAVQITYAVDKGITKEAEEALHRALVTSRVRVTLRGHTAEVWSVAFSPDAMRLATASQDKTAKVWDAHSGQLLLTLSGHTDSVNGIAFSPDGTKIATSSDDHTAKLWDAATGKELLTFVGHQKLSRRLAFSPDGKWLATSSADKTARIWDVATGQELLRLQHADRVQDLAFSPDGQRLATAIFSSVPGVDSVVTLWDATTGQQLLTLSVGEPALIYGVAFSPDGQRVAGAGNFAGGGVIVWDAQSGRELVSIRGGSSRVEAIAFSPDGRWLATGGLDRQVKIWDAATGREALTLSGHTRDINRLVFSADGTRLATASPDGTAKVWDVTPSHEALMMQPGAIRIDLSRDGRQLLSGHSDGTVRLWDAASGQELLTLRGNTKDILSVAFSPDGTRAATGSGDHTAIIWDLATGRPLRTLQLPDGVWAVAFSPDGTRLATGVAVTDDTGRPANDTTARVWDVSTGQQWLTLAGHTDGVVSVAFSPDGRQLTTGSVDKTARVWDLSSGKALLTLTGHKDIVWSVAFSADGRRVATASRDGTGMLWDASTGRPLFTFRGHNGPVLKAAFSPDGRRVATVSLDRTVKVWDTARGQEVLTLLTDSSGFGLAYTPDGTRLVVGGSAGIRVYLMRIEDMMALAGTRVTRMLTTDECQTFLHTTPCPP